MFYRAALLCVIICLSIFSIITAREIVYGSQPEPAQFRLRSRPDIDMFMGHWKDSKPRRIFGSLEVRDILTKCNGNPLRPREKGAVLTDLISVSYAVLTAHKSTEAAKLKGKQLIFYINSGEGVIKTENRTSELYEGIGVILPPGIEFNITNTGGELLTMYLIEEPIPKGFTPNKEMVVKYEYDNKISTNINRVDKNNWLLSIDDGLSTLVAFNPIMYEPRSLVPPHVHDEGVEEVWIALKGEVHIQVGSQRRKFPPGSAYKVPANGITPHTNINNTDVSKKLMWMMKVPVSRVPVRKKPEDKKDVI